MPYHHSTLGLFTPRALFQPAQNPPDLLPFLGDDDLPLPFLEDVPQVNPDDPAAPNPDLAQNPVPPAEDPPANPVVEQPAAAQPDLPSPSLSDQSADEAGMTTAPSSPVVDPNSTRLHQLNFLMLHGDLPLLIAPLQILSLIHI